MTQKLQNALMLVLKYGLGFAILGFVLYVNYDHADPDKIDLGKLLEYPVQAGPLVLAFVLGAVGVVLTFVRWFVLVRAQELPNTLYDAFRIGALGFYYNTVLPGAIGGDLVKGVAIARSQSRRTVAVATVIADRIVGLWALVWVVSLLGAALRLSGDTLLAGNNDLLKVVRVSWWLLGGSLLAWVMLGLLPPWRVERFAGRLAGIPKIGHSLSELWRAVAMYRRKTRAVLLGLFLSVGSHAMYVATFHCAVRVFQPGDLVAEFGTFFEHALIVPLGMVFQALFPTPGGVGGAEAAFGWLYLNALHKPEAFGIIGSLAQRAVNWGLGLTGYLVYLRLRPGNTAHSPT